MNSLDIYRKDIVIGTAQFQVNYGVSHIHDNMGKERLENLLKLARKYNIQYIDTAPNYGECEKVLGEIGVEDFKVITKIEKRLSKNLSIESWINESIERSLTLLGIKKIYGLLIHNSRHFDKTEFFEVINTLNRLKARELVDKIGLSIYDPNELDQIDSPFSFDVIQAPSNLIDRRLTESGWLEKLIDKKVEVHFRSIFMQGLLLLPKEKMPNKFDRWNTIFEKWHLYIEANKFDPLEVCVKYAFSQQNSSKVLVGVESAEQLEEIIRYKSSENKLNLDDLLFMKSEDRELLDPYNWINL